jgi:glycosyltransferase involved in cell wall biosynthesis
VGYLPLVSVVTPSFNAARFLEETIRSVLMQDYPRIEYIVIDGGSTDGTLDILKAHGTRLKYASGRDEGAADALNKGFAIANGEILAWLNADDAYLPGAASRAVEALGANPDAAAVYGEGYWVGAGGETLGRYPTGSCDVAALGRECCICQPSCFIRRSAMESVGMLNAELQASFDYDLWIRIAKRYRLLHIPEYLAASRMHVENKTLGQRKIVFKESIDLLRRHYKYVPVRWVYGYLSFLRDRGDQFFEPLRHSISTYLLSLPAGMRYNYRHPFKYLAEWMSAVKPSNLPKLWRRDERHGFGGLE